MCGMHACMYVCCLIVVYDLRLHFKKLRTLTLNPQLLKPVMLARSYKTGSLPQRPMLPNLKLRHLKS